MSENVKRKSSRARYPTSIRLPDEYLSIADAIIAAYSPPGIKLSMNDAIIIALNYWQENYKRPDNKP